MSQEIIANAHPAPQRVPEPGSNAWAGLQLLFMLVLFVTMMGFAAKMLLPPNAWLTSSQERDIEASLRTKMPAYVRAAFKSFHADQGVQGAMAPTLEFEGATAELLNIDEPEISTTTIFGRTSTGKVMLTDVIARTPNGRYFSVRYQFDLHDLQACAEAPNECLQVVVWDLSLGKDGAMRDYFNSSNFDPARFQQIFGVAPPPHKVPA